MLRRFFEIIRPGKRQKSTIGRSSFGTAPRKLIIDWFNSRTPTELFEQSVGTPSMRDILRCVRPRPLDRSRSAMYAWFVGKNHEPTLLPSKVQHFEQWKSGATEELPNVPFQMLTNTKLSTDQWTLIARRAGWKWLLKNINNMIRHEVFKNHPEMVDFVAERLSDRKSVQKACTFPYEILTAYQHVKDAPQAIQKAFHVALDVATENVPLLPEAKNNPSAYLFVDVSKSMSFMVKGNRYGIGNRANTSMTRADVAALIACSILRRNAGSEILLFNTKVVDKVINPKVSVLENSTAISKMADGGTACSSPLHLLNEQGRHGDLIITVSDDQSWAESMGIDRYGNPLPVNSPLLTNGKTAFQHEWEVWKARNPNSKLVCIDIAPYTTKQVQKDKDVLNIGGFSDVVFDLCGSFAAGRMNPNHLVGVIEGIDLDATSLNRDNMFEE
jgi:60 kDa SS-A/Ro ribonucleoprotein